MKKYKYSLKYVHKNGLYNVFFCCFCKYLGLILPFRGYQKLKRLLKLTLKASMVINFDRCSDEIPSIPKPWHSYDDVFKLFCWMTAVQVSTTTYVTRQNISYLEHSWAWLWTMYRVVSGIVIVGPV